MKLRHVKCWTIGKPLGTRKTFILKDRLIFDHFK